MAILDGQVEVMTISRGPSMGIIESQLEAIAAPPGLSMAIFDGPNRGCDDCMVTWYDCI